MTIFVVISDPDSPSLGQEIQRIYGAESINLASGQWLVSSKDKKTTKEITDSLGASEGRFGRIAAFAVSGYFGYHRPEIW